ncbi:MAG: hypothetical protein AMXMBFR53_07190 [Gemmatimonadota bacterium]
MEGTGHGPYEAEARERWGDTEAYEESARRAKAYRAEDWAAIKAEAEKVEAGLAAVLAAGGAADGEDATALAEEARRHIDRWFYPCSHRMHVGLAEMYTDDPRFAAHYDGRAPGLAAFVAAAIRANAARHGA